MYSHGDAPNGKNRGKGKQLTDIIARTELNNDVMQEERSEIATETQSLLPWQGNVLSPKEDRMIRIGIENINGLKPVTEAQESRKKMQHFLVIVFLVLTRSTTRLL